MKTKNNLSKQLLNLMLCLALMLTYLLLSSLAAYAVAPTGMWSDSAAESFAGGTGVKEDPYLIRTAAELAKLSKDVAAGTKYAGVYFRLENDIDLSAHRWTPIGYEYIDLADKSQRRSFEGVLDGNERVITGLYVDERASGRSAGLFGYIRGTQAHSPSVHDLEIRDAVIYAGDENCIETYSGILTGTASAQDIDSLGFENIKVSGTIINEANYDGVVSGGMVGIVDRGHFTSCEVADITISGANSTGGFAGIDGECRFVDCIARGSVSGTWAMGGFSGYSYSAFGTGGDDIVQSTFIRCLADVDVTASDWRAGGFVGFAEAGVFENCVALGDVTSTVNEDFEPKVGGFCGEIMDAQMAKCHAAGVVTSDESKTAGGFIGYDECAAATVDDCSFDVESNKALQAIGVVDPDLDVPDYAIAAASKNEVATNICEDHYGNTAHHYIDALDSTCEDCGYVRAYTVTFVADGKTVSAIQVEAGKDAVAPGIPAKVGYTGVWDQDGKKITADTEINAVYTVNVYTITLNYPTFVREISVNHGMSFDETYSDIDANVDLAAEKDYHSFIGWYESTDGGTTLKDTPYDFNADVTGDVTLYPMFEIYTYTVTYKADGKVVGTVTVEHGADAVAPAIPEKEGHTQTAPTWDQDGKNITADTEINAVYTINEYTVTIMDENGVYKTVTVKHGEKVTMPEVPKKDGYTVTWEKVLDTVTEDVTVKAVYTEIPATDKPSSPQTGDTTNLWLWVALLFVSGGAIVTLAVMTERKGVGSK